MKSVTDQILGDGALDAIVEAGITTRDEEGYTSVEYNGVDPLPGDPRQLAELIESTSVEPVRKITDDDRREALANAKLRVALSTADRTHAAKPTGVTFVTPSRDQHQEIFDDGSIRNPYKKMRAMSGRQRRNMRKQANRTMKSRGIDSRIEDALKGRQRPQTSPQTMAVPSQPPAPEPLTEVGIPVADILGDSR